MSKKINGYRALLLVTEEEMWQLMQENQLAGKAPGYYCITKNGTILIYPKLDPSRFKLMCAEGQV